MTRRKRVPQDLSRSGARQRHPKGCAAIRAWMEKFGSEEELTDEAKGELLRLQKEPAWMQCFEEFFQQASESDRESILRWAVPILGSRVQPFLQRVLSDRETTLKTQRDALNQLRELGAVVEGDLLQSLEKAEEFLKTRFPAVTSAAEVCEAPDAEMCDLFCALPVALRISVVREIVVRDPRKTAILLERVLDRQLGLPEGILPVLGVSPEEETARLLSKWYDRVESKAFRKEIKRTLHKRRVRGLAVREPEAAETGVPVWKPPVPAQPVGLLSMPDSTGSRMVWVMRQQIPRGILAFSGWVHDLDGLKEIMILEFSKKESENFKRTLLEDEKLSAVETDAAYCAYLIEEAYRKAPPVSPDQKEMYQRLRGLLTELIPAEAPVSPIHAVWQADAFEEGSALEDPFGGAGSLLEKGALENWFLETDRLKPFVDRLEEIQESRIIVHPLQKQERIASFQQETTRELFLDLPYRMAWKRRIEDAAWILYKKGLESDSRRLSRISRYLGSPENDASRVPFLVQFVQKTLKVILESKKSEEAARPSLIVKPGAPVR